MYYSLHRMTIKIPDASWQVTQMFSNALTPYPASHEPQRTPSSKNIYYDNMFQDKYSQPFLWQLHCESKSSPLTM